MMPHKRGHPHLIERLPEVRGRYEVDAPLAAYTWFRVGGPAEVLFRPADRDDLKQFLARRPNDVPVTVIGVGSNLLVRDGGVPGVVIRMGKSFAGVDVEGTDRLRAGAAALDVHVARTAQQTGLAGLEFYRGIPGTIGGALRMNAGAYGRETKDVFLEASGLRFDGTPVHFTPEEMGFAYRHCDAPEDVIFIDALFQGTPDEPQAISRRMEAITEIREDVQPVRERTGGSTFKNPDPDVSGSRRAWQLIDEAGCRGLACGAAKVSEKHCNFLINGGDATAEQIEALGEEVRRRVAEATGIELDWEIRRIGIAGRRQTS